TAAEKGTILHKVMEQLDFHQMAEIWSGNNGKETNLAEIQAVVSDLVKRDILTEEEAGVVSYQKIIGFFDSEIGKRACSSGKLYKEISFNIMKELSGEKIIIQGTIDCYFEEDGTYILLDYKSNYIADMEDGSEIERMTESYKVQLELYREALERIRGIKVKEAYLYLFHISQAIRIF
ncbi:MAG TPA: PD-(D/E)XK nuclease family protein, partial [Anaerovoracaceae bacterium]|nr:PD-(D/E)XK nuclease family protein [Anaerovoracaceae bacterium]